MRRPSKTTLALLVLLSIGPIALVAAPKSSNWTRLGPGGGTATKLIADPTSASVLYAATVSAGVF
jgi:hypothetical protein